jgi:hypothetical protein
MWHHRNANHSRQDWRPCECEIDSRHRQWTRRFYEREYLQIYLIFSIHKFTVTPSGLTHRKISDSTLTFNAA